MTQFSEPCPVCGNGTATEIAKAHTVVVLGEQYRIPEDVSMKCDTCGEVYYTHQQLRDRTRKLNGMRAERLGQLSPNKIREGRKAIGWSQQELEQYLRLGSKTVTRWENGDQLPKMPTDFALRMLFEYGTWSGTSAVGCALDLGSELRDLFIFPSVAASGSSEEEDEMVNYA